MRFWTLIILILPVLISPCCSNEAQQIVDKAIKVHGGTLYERMYLEFDFRGRHYTARRFGGRFTYTRMFADSSGVVEDILTNDHFTRIVNGDTANIPQERARAYSNSVNSVIYFALLPQALNDPAVNKELLGVIKIGNKKYYKVKVTFDKKGGGKDHDDVFVFWFDKKSFMMDYFGYLFYSDGGGIRFREAIDTTCVKGIILADYMNYALNDTTFDITRIDSLFLMKKLKPLSEIRLENIKIDILDD